MVKILLRYSYIIKESLMLVFTNGFFCGFNKIIAKQIKLQLKIGMERVLRICIGNVISRKCRKTAQLG